VKSKDYPAHLIQNLAADAAQTEQDGHHKTIEFNTDHFVHITNKLQKYRMIGKESA